MCESIVKCIHICSEEIICEYVKKNIKAQPKENMCKERRKMKTSFFYTQEQTIHILLKSVTLRVFSYIRSTHLNTRLILVFVVKRI